MSFVPKLVNLAAALAASTSAITVANAQHRGGLSIEQKEKIVKDLLLSNSRSQNAIDEGAIDAYKKTSLDGQGHIFLNGHKATIYTKAPEVTPLLTKEDIDGINSLVMLVVHRYEKKHSEVTQWASTEEEYIQTYKRYGEGMETNLYPAVFHKGTQYTVDFNTARICTKELETSEPQDCFAVKELPPGALEAQIGNVKGIYLKKEQFKPFFKP